MNIKDDFILKNVNDGYLVGGSVRDSIMGKSFIDRDIAIKNAEEFTRMLSEKLDATFIVLDDINKIFRLVLKDKINYLDISELRGNSIEDDLVQRDFTINAIAYDLKNEKFIDVTGGIDDIKKQKLRHIKESNFTDDPLRLLRAFRFMSTTGFQPVNELVNILNKHRTLILHPAKERIHDEILKLFGGKYAYKTLLNMYEMGYLELIFPCVTEFAKVPKNSHHHLDLIHHVMETVKWIEIQYEYYSEYSNEKIPEKLNNLGFVIKKLSGNDNKKIYEHLNRIDFGGYPRINFLKIAGFLHDIGKFSTWTIEESGRHRFIKHDLIGAKMVVPLLKILKFSNKQIDYISEMVKQHIYPSNVIAAENLDNKIMMRYVRKMSDNVIDNIILAIADRLSAQGPDITAKMTENNVNGLINLLEFYLGIRDSLKPIPKLLDGKEIMQILGIKPSPQLGLIISELREAQLNQEINNKDDAVSFVKKYVQKSP